MNTETIECFLVKAVQKAALAAFEWVGKGDSHAADEAATNAMRQQFSASPYAIRVVIGEGERDSAPMLYRGEILGESHHEDQSAVFAAEGVSHLQKSAFPLDCAVDPCDGTSLVKKGLPGAITIAVLSEKGGLKGAPDFYMEKLAAPAAARGWVTLEQTPAERVRGLCEALGKLPEELCIAVQERPRHEKLVAELRASGARVQLFGEGDITVALQCVLADSGTRYDALMGIGAAPEGIITAAAFECMGGLFQGRFAYDPAEVMSGLIGTCKATNYQKMLDAGIEHPDKYYDSSELASGKNLFVALCGITNGEVIRGIEQNHSGVRVTESLLFTSGQLAPRRIREIHQ